MFGIDSETWAAGIFWQPHKQTVFVLSRGWPPVPVHQLSPSKLKFETPSQGEPLLTVLAPSSSLLPSQAFVDHELLEILSVCRWESDSQDFRLQRKLQRTTDHPNSTSTTTEISWTSSTEGLPGASKVAITLKPKGERRSNLAAILSRSTRFDKALDRVARVAGVSWRMSWIFKCPYLKMMFGG